jgi:hypothetical protein
MPIPPPSFSSFPDIEGSSRKDSEKQIHSRDKVEDSDRKKRKRDRRDKHPSRARIPSRERGRGKEDLRDDSHIFDDERKKAEEDLARRTRQQDVSRPTFFSDKKGDQLNLQYGGIYSGDVPKYHLVGRALCSA